MVKSQPRVTSQPQGMPTPPTRPVGGRMGTSRPHDYPHRLPTLLWALDHERVHPADRWLVFPLSNALGELARDFLEEAQAMERDGGAWGRVIGMEHRRAAAQLRLVRWMLHRDPTDHTIQLAQDWRTAARHHLARVQEASR